MKSQGVDGRDCAIRRNGGVVLNETAADARLHCRKQMSNGCWTVQLQPANNATADSAPSSVL